MVLPLASAMTGGSAMRGTRRLAPAAVHLLFAGASLAQNANWVQQHPQSSPSVRTGNGLAYDPVRSPAVLFGGSDSVTPSSLGNTWVWDGSTWTQKFPQTSPPARFAHV